MSQIIIVLFSDEGELLAQVSDKETEAEGSDVYVAPIVPYPDALIRGELAQLLLLMAMAYVGDYPLEYVRKPEQAGGWQLVRRADQELP